MSRHHSNCALCHKPTRVGKRGTYTHATGRQIYLCHGVPMKNDQKDCYVAVSNDPELRARLTGKEVTV